MRGHHRADEGFTLLEMVIVILILGVILAPLMSSFVLSLKTTKEAVQTTTTNADKQITSQFFGTDAASSEQVSTTSSCVNPGETPVAQFDWVDGTVHKYVAYVLTPDTFGASPAYQLQRNYCETPNTVISSAVLARSLATVPVLTCDGGSCTGNPKPATVRLALDQYGAAAGDPHVSFTVTGTRRVTT